MVNSEEEKELVRRVKAHDPEAWREMLTLYGGRLYGLSLRFLLNEKDAEDVMQDVWITVSRKINDFREQSRLNTWLYRVTVNKCLERIRRRKRTVTESIDETLPRFNGSGRFADKMTDWSQKPAAAVDSKFLKDEIEAVIRQVPDHYREVLVLRDIEGLSGQETGTLLDLSEAAVKTRLHRARAFVRERLSKKFGEKPWFAFMRML